MHYIRHWLAALFVALPAFAASAADDNVCSRDLPVRASTCLVDTGLARCRSLLDEDPENFSIRLAVCDGLVAEGNPQGAKGLMESATRVHQRSSTQQLIRRAVDNVEEYITFQERKPQGPDPVVLRDYLQLRCMEYRNALACGDLLGLDPEMAGPNIVLAEIALENDLATEAVSRFLIAAKSDPETVTPKLENALAARSNALAPCFSGTTREALDACEGNLIPGYEDESRIRLRSGDIHLLAGRYGNAIHAYEHNSTGTTGERRTRLTSNIQQCSSDSVAACNRVIDLAGDNRLFKPLRAAALKNRCLATLKTEDAQSVTKHCDNALENMAIADANEIRSILQQRELPAVDPLQAIEQACAADVTRYGWDTASCRSLAEADARSELGNQARSELDRLSIEACSRALELSNLETARPICNQSGQQAYLAATRASISALLAGTEQTVARQGDEDAADPGGAMPLADDSRSNEAATDKSIAIAGNGPRDSEPGVYVVTY